MIQKQKT